MPDPMTASPLPTTASPLPAPGRAAETNRVPALSYFFPAHDEAENIEALVAEGAP